ncbi:hypothetical protein WN51_13272 [Melipona quadrifasciata]|uniref:Uncharacterized protein n=1 Tax=Melipona quadrifasciata TaxID=166423 RepID=A0A0N0BGT1_9HYME|nr:hypothetical protein WN51_13272 [Melipona quadrifasciata]
MASSASEVSRGAKKRTVLTGRLRADLASGSAEDEVGLASSQNGEDGRDSGLSSESSTPTVGSPIPRQRKTTSNPINIAVSSVKSRFTSQTGRNDCDKTTKVWRSRSVTDSPRSVDSTRTRQFSSPLRISRNIQSPSLDSGDEGSLRLDRDTYQHMFQDIVSIKTMLLKLKRVLQESEENSLTRAETLNPFDNTMKNGLFCNDSGTADVSTSPGTGGSNIVDELADLRRQVVFLQGQVEDRDRTIQVLQFQISKLQGPNSDGQTCALINNHKNLFSSNTCNAATQTEKTRPVSAGPSLLQTLPQEDVMGSLVRWSDSSDRHRPSLLGELNGNRSPRKSTDRIPRTIKSRLEDTSHRQTGNTDKLPTESPSNKRIVKSKDTKSTESNDKEQHEVKREENLVKSCIPTARKFSTIPIPRSARAVTSSIGRPHNT